MFAMRDHDLAWIYAGEIYTVAGPGFGSWVFKICNGKKNHNLNHVSDQKLKSR
jgi:hypothetical protein